MDYRLVCLLAVVAMISAEQKLIDMDAEDNSPCSQAYNFTYKDTALVETKGSILGKSLRPLKPDHSVKFCRVILETVDTVPNCDVRQLCVAPSGPLSRQCFAGVILTWRENGGLNEVRHVDLSNCVGKEERVSEYCAHGDTLEIEVFESTLRPYRKYAFSANVRNMCTDEKYEATTKPARIDHDIEFRNLKEEVHTTRVYGIITGVCLCSIFLVALVITYFYYKNKAYTGVPTKA